MEDRFSFTGFVMHIALLVVLLALINMTFDLHRFAFLGNFLILLFFLVMGLIAVIGLTSNFQWTYKLLAVFSVLVFLDMLFVNAITTQKTSLFLNFLLVAVAGFFISLFSIRDEKEKVVAVEKTFKPGKYVGSKMGKTVHKPKCDWAKRIKKKNQVWFDSKEEAKKAGYSAHDCV